MAILLRTDGTKELLLPIDGKTLSLKQMQDAVGGSIEIVTTSDNSALLVVNENEKLNTMLHNEQATRLYGNPDDIIVGDAVLADFSEVD